jgi:hypothetical protein
MNFTAQVRRLGQPAHSSLAHRNPQGLFEQVNKTAQLMTHSITEMEAAKNSKKKWRQQS